MTRTIDDVKLGSKVGNRALYFTNGEVWTVVQVNSPDAAAPIGIKITAPREGGTIWLTVGEFFKRYAPLEELTPFAAAATVRKNRNNGTLVVYLHDLPPGTLTGYSGDFIRTRFHHLSRTVGDLIYDAEGFQSAYSSLVSATEAEQQEMIALCAQCGIQITVTEELPTKFPLLAILKTQV